MSTQDAESPCPLNNSGENHHDRYNPANQETATCYQLHDALRVAFGLAHYSTESFERGLRMIETHIAAYRQTVSEVQS